MSPVKSLAGRFVIDDWEGAFLGSGGMGSVYRGLDMESGEEVAIKVLRPEITAEKPALVERFLREGEALRKLHHPNIVELLAAIVDDGQHYLIMEYIKGGSLRGALERNPQLPLEQVVRVGLELSDALSRVHHLGIIHRDLKPANVLLAEDGSPRLTDFGVARFAEGTPLTGLGSVIGTLAYLSPEACDGEELDARTDIWSFGVMLYEMLAGERPFRGASATAVVGAIICQEVPSLRQRRPSTPPSLVDLVRSMLTKYREERVSSVRRVGAELEAILDDIRAVQQSDTVEVLPPPRADDTVPGLTTRPGFARRRSAVRAEVALSPERRAQRILLGKVRRFWIDGVLRDSLDHESPLDLSVRDYHEAVVRPWDGVADPPRQDAAERTSAEILDQYRQAQGALLLLGEPGSGKTTTLLQLTERLLDSAENDANEPVPVILNLASWAENRQSIDRWIEMELLAKYQVPRTMSRGWLENNQLCLLLDELDAAQYRDRDACIVAINRFRREYGLAGIVVTCRVDSYEQSRTKLEMGGALRLQPLTADQIDDYLGSSKRELGGLRDALRQGSELKQMAQSPLMLHLLRQVSAEKQGAALASTLPGLAEPAGADTGIRRRRVLDAYVSQMFDTRRYRGARVDGMRKRLGRLARGMQEHNQRVFLVEQLQSSWLAARTWQWIHLLATRLTVGIVVGLLSHLAVYIRAPAHRGYAAEWLSNASALFGLTPEFAAPLAQVLAGACAGLAVAIVDGLHFERHRGDDVPHPHLRAGMADVLSRCLAVFLLGALAYRMFLGWATSATEAMLLIVACLVCFNFLVTSRSFRSDIRPVEALSWSWARIWLHAAWGVGAGLSVLFVHMFNRDPRTGVTLGCVVFLFFCVIGGLRAARMDNRTKTNHGIRASLENSFRAAVLVAPIGSVFWLMWGWQAAAPGIVVILLAAGLVYGLYDVIKHYWLRLLLATAERVPLRLVRFLDQAVASGLLRKVGGGYIFVHPLLQDYFAGRLSSAAASEEATRCESE